MGSNTMTSAPLLFSMRFFCLSFTLFPTKPPTREIKKLKSGANRSPGSTIKPFSIWLLAPKLHMDPATIIGTTSAILSFVQFSAKVISTAIEIRDNAGQATKSNQALGETVKDFNSRLATLRLQTPVLQSNLHVPGFPGVDADAKLSLLRCVARCEELGSSIEALLHKIEGPGKDNTRKSGGKFKSWKSTTGAPSSSPSSPQAKPSSSLPLTASLKSLWSEKEIKSLREQWEQCVRDFNVSFMRLDIQTRLQALSDDNSTKLKALQDDFQTLAINLKDSNFKALWSFLDDYNIQNSLKSKEKRNCDCILKSLEFPGMDARRDQIKDAERNTFNWLLRQDSIPYGHDDLEISLRKWLATGTGVYHITGKPGSGKSTLMKLVGESDKSHETLQKWARRGQKQLITANFFTWKAADSNLLQNRVEGMIRTLIHQILTHKPELMSKVFPEHWHPETYHTHSATKDTKLRWPEIQKAFERIFVSPVLTRNFRVFLLIDGMDEFDDPGEPHFRIARLVKGWCERNPDNVKACVSSREDRPFMDAFPAQQRLRLHLVTSEDIRRLTEERLMEHPHFSSSFFKDWQREDLIHSITEQAQGVFLWVILTIVELTHRLDARQGFDAIKEVVWDSNQNLNMFIKEILSRVPNTYAREAQNLFRLVQFTIRTSFTLDLFHVHKAITLAKAPGCLTDCANHTVSYEEAVAEVEEFKSRLPTISRGLLELIELKSYESCVLAGPNARYRVSYIHRSIFEFFEENPNSIWKSDPADNFPKELSLIIRSSTHIACTLTWQQPEISGEHPWLPTHHWQDFIADIVGLRNHPEVNNRTADPESCFLPLKALDEALLHKQCILAKDVQLDSSQWSDVCLPAHRFVDDTASVFLAACTSSHIKLSCDSDSEAQDDDVTKCRQSNADFGLEVTVGSAPTRQLSPGPRWPRMQDTLLMRFLLFHFGLTTGTASQVDILKVISSILRDISRGQHVSYRRELKRLDLAIAALGEAMAQDTRPDFSENKPVDSNALQSLGALETIETTAQDVIGTGPDEAKQLELHVQALNGLPREYRVLTLSILGALLSMVLWFVLTGTGVL
ncbi:hypothetical protein DHEL01_v209759 [Diaporthe helianthi]|uniref:Nephrocystin 3-like N-terminal domain-containing protein n=1 Tax=Diaporthe helianthi TaxID=158607 RepID=A0A2P5HNP5_DIAHE|nr:hypothetical protein DHEL01_v209759 [Diaporthe helianthi]